MSEVLSMNIVLIGYRCTGKTGVGKILACKLEKDFVDTDALIEDRAGCSIETMVSKTGWDHFRMIEKEMIECASMKGNLIIATGGGAVMDEENMKNLKRNGWIVWLKGNPDILKERMEKARKEGDIRPSLTGADVLEEIRHMLHLRMPLYEQAASHVVDTSALNMKEVAASIMEALPKGWQ
jgi:shikimate kinase